MTQCNEMDMEEYVVPFISSDEMDAFLINGNRVTSYDYSIDTKVLPILPISPNGPPIKDTLPGPYNFNIEINSAHTQKNKYMYSHKLHRIYVDMKQNFSVNFNWNASELQHPMYVRATVVFSDATQAEKRVERCNQHFYELSQSDGGVSMSEAEKKHVLRSARAPGSPDVFYCGEPAQVDSWFSVVVLFPEPSSHAYTFVCKNSCNSGINRRATSIIFTLEDINGMVYGRDSVGVRACSCPRRDMKRDESDEAPAGKRRLPPAAPPAVPAPASKAPRLELARTADQLVHLPQMTIVGHSAAITGLTVMRNMMKQTRSHRLANHQPVEDLDKAIADVKKQIDLLENTTHNDN